MLASSQLALALLGALALALAPGVHAQNPTACSAMAAGNACTKDGSNSHNSVCPDLVTVIAENDATWGGILTDDGWVKGAFTNTYSPDIDDIDDNSM